MITIVKNCDCAFVKAKETLMSGVQLFFSIFSLEFSSKAYSTAVLVDLQLDMLAAAFYSCSSKYIFSMYFHLAIVNFRGDEIIIVLPLRRLVYFHSKISYVFRWTSWIDITGALSKSSKILEVQVYSLLSKFSTHCT